MPNKRSISKSKRFEVFKRDSFTCQYCGASAPDILLEIDHIEPVSKGGDNEITNLITSCYECNRGKGARKLSEDSELKKQKNEMDKRQEKINQRKMLIEWRKTLEDDKDQLKQDINQYFNIVTGYLIKEESNFYKEDLTKIAKKFDFDIICEAIDRGKKSYNEPDKILEKLGGICFFTTRERKEPGYRGAFYIFTSFVKNYNLGYIDKENKEDYIKYIIRSMNMGIDQILHSKLMSILDLKEYERFITDCMRVSDFKKMVDLINAEFGKENGIFNQDDIYILYEFLNNSYNVKAGYNQYEEVD